MPQPYPPQPDWQDIRPFQKESLMIDPGSSLGAGHRSGAPGSTGKRPGRPVFHPPAGPGFPGPTAGVGQSPEVAPRRRGCGTGPVDGCFSATGLRFTFLPTGTWGSRVGRQARAEIRHAIGENTVEPPPTIPSTWALEGRSGPLLRGGCAPPLRGIFPEIGVGNGWKTGLSQPPYGIHTGHQSSQRTRRPL